MQTQGDLEPAVGPKLIQAHMTGHLPVVGLQGVLIAAEQRLLYSLPANKVRDLLKKVRTHLIETACPLMESMMQEVTGSRAVSLRHDISTTTGDDVVPFALAESPLYRETKKRLAS